MDPQTVEQVWQRVRQTAQPAEEPTLQALEAQARKTAGQCRQLASHAPGPRRAMLLQVARLKAGQSACLRGLGIVTGEPVGSPRTPRRRAASRPSLQDCCARELQCLDAYTTLCAQQPLGQVYAQLLRSQRQVCQSLLMLLG